MKIVMKSTIYNIFVSKQIRYGYDGIFEVPFKQQLEKHYRALDLYLLFPIRSKCIDVSNVQSTHIINFVFLSKTEIKIKVVKIF